MLVAELGVPVHLCIVEGKNAAALADLDEQVVGPGKDLVGEDAELVLRADVARLVDDGPEVRVLVQDDLGDDLLVRQVLLAEVEVGDVAGRVEAAGDLIAEVLWEDGLEDVDCGG